MRDRKCASLIYVLTFTCFFLIGVQANAQVVHAGVKGGLNLSWVRPSERNYRELYDISPVLGYNAGLAFNFNIRDRYFLHSELLYSTKGRVTTGDLELDDRAIYNFIEIPLAYNVSFKKTIDTKHVKQFKWYIGFGPNFSYWLGGKGKIMHYDFREFENGAQDYKIKFGGRPEEEEGKNDVVYVSNANRFQLGLNLGGGILLEPMNGKKIMLDVRFELGHSWYGLEDSMDRVIPASYNEDLRTRNMGLRVSGMYMLEFNTDKKVRNRGKSTKKIRRR